jgi:hypothetical protein
MLYWLLFIFVFVLVAMLKNGSGIWVTGLENVFVKKYEELMCYVFPLRGGHRFNIFVSSKFSFLGLLRTHAFDIRVGLEEDLWNGMSYWVF